MKYAWECLREFLIFVAFIAAAAAAQLAFSQDGAQSVLEQQHATGTLEPIPVSTFWQQETQAKLDAAGKIAGPGNRNVSVVIEPGRYEFVSLRIPPHVSLVFGTGLSPREGDLVYVGNGGDTCITVDGDGLEGTSKGYGMTLAGCQIRPKNPNVAMVCAIKVEAGLNCKVANVRTDFRGVDCAGLIVDTQESLVVERCELRAAMPVIYERGDNVVFRDMDLGANGNAVYGIDAVVTLKRNPHHVVFEGSQTWQGGTYAIRGVTSDNGTGQGLILNNVRWEQSTANREPGILIECENRAFETLTQINCRWSPRWNTATVVTYPEGSALTPKQTEIGCMKIQRVR